MIIIFFSDRMKLCGEVMKYFYCMSLCDSFFFNFTVRK